VLAPGSRVSDELAAIEVLDREGHGSALGLRWRDRPALLVFLRHFGCIACAEHVALMCARVPELVRLGIAVVFVGNGASQFIAGFVERNQLGGQPVELVTDPSLRSFAALALVHSRGSLVSPRALLNFLRGRLAGFRHHGIEGDSLQQGGVLLVDRGGVVRYLHRDHAAGDHAPTADVVDAALALAAAHGDARGT
jgi:AhpC/TSA antioxidant enzyme